MEDRQGRAVRRLAALLVTVGLVLLPVGTASANEACDVRVTRYVATKPPAFAMLGIEKAWPLSRGGVRVAVVDSGVQASNAHLSGAVDPGHSFVDGTDGRTDVFGHGTAIAGQIAARPVKGSGLVGIAPAARIVPVKVYLSEREGEGPTPARTAQGIRWAADQPGVKVIVVAMSSASADAGLKAAVEHAASRGILVVASAGNANTPDAKPGQPMYPAAWPTVLSVTAVAADGSASPTVLHGPHVGIAGPGSQVLTTFLGAGDCMMASDPSSSYAAGYVAGVAALVAARHPGEKPADWMYRLKATAMRPASSGRSDSFGWGIVAPHAALTFVNDGSVAGPANPRFPQPTPAVPPLMPQPAVVPDHTPTIQFGVALACLIGAAVAVGGVLVRRLRRD